jgi:phosphatidate cytidylyltransferase
MKTRSLSAIGVVVVGIIPAILGGPVWAAVFMLISLIAFTEYHGLASRISGRVSRIGILILPFFAWIPWSSHPERLAIGLAGLAVLLPMIGTTRRKNLTGAVSDWALAAAGTLYLGLPLVAAVELRTMDGSVSREWLTDLDRWVSVSWADAPRGLAWLMTVILCTWLSDTFAYLVGRKFGSHKLSPVVSPNKSVEGFVGGLVAAAVTGVLCFWGFGLTTHWWWGLLFGLVIAWIGLYGDLAESVLKRQAGMKDSSHLIPGHGGMLDRIDALLFTFVAGWYLALAFDRYLL